MCFPGPNGSVHAQEVEQGIRGIVLNKETGKPIENANILIEGTRRGVISGPSGRFIIRELPPGEYVLQVSVVGFLTMMQEVSVQANRVSRVEFQLEPVAYALDSVSVVRGRIYDDPVETPSMEPVSLQVATSLVARERMDKTGATDLVDAMKYVPGGLVESRGRKVKQFFSIRGQKYPYPDYAINGIWQKEFHELPYFIPASYVESIEIVRSSAALLTGLSGLAGVIKVNTREPERKTTTAELEYGSFKTFNGHFFHGGKSGQVKYSTGLGYRSTAGPEGKHARENMGSFIGQIGWEPLQRMEIRANLMLLNGKRELRVAEPPAAPKFINFRQRYDPFRTALGNIKFYYRQSGRSSSELHVYYSLKDPVMIDETEHTEVNEKDYEYGINFVQALSLFKGNNLRVGGLYNHWVAPEGKRFYVGNTCDTETFSLVAVDEQNFGVVTLDGGFRWTKTYMNEYGAFNIEGSSRDFRTVAPITDEWMPSEIQASFGARYDLWDQGSLAFHSAFGNIRPRDGALDIDLEKPGNEDRFKLDLGYRSGWGRTGNYSLTAFSVIQQDAIVYSGETYENPVTGLDMELYENRDQMNYGIELTGQTPRLWNVLNAFANGVYTKSFIKEDGDRVINREQPEFIINGGVFFRKGQWDVNLAGKYISAFENDRYAGPAGPQPLGDFFAADITAGYMIRSIRSRVYLKVINLTDRRYSTVVGYPDFGRRIYAGIKYNMDRQFH